MNKEIVNALYILPCGETFFGDFEAVFPDGSYGYAAVKIEFLYFTVSLGKDLAFKSAVVVISLGDSVS